MLGTASQAPTRYRNHNGYLLLWDGEGILFDPGEGTQRQMLLAGVAASAITRICITHFHGDHCLGLPGVLQRLSLDRVRHAVQVHYPASGEQYLQRLRHASIFEDYVELIALPVKEPGIISSDGSFSLIAGRLDHVPDTFGWRIEEPAGRRILVERLEAFGLRGPLVGKLEREGSIELDGHIVRIEDVSEHRSGQRVAFVMDTGWCDAVLELAEEVDLLICEATFSSADEALARAYHHLTAAQAARIALEAGARRLVLTHFSQRYPDTAGLLAEAAEIFPDVVAATDLMRVAVPPRR